MTESRRRREYHKLHLASNTFSFILKKIFAGIILVYLEYIMFLLVS